MTIPAHDDIGIVVIFHRNKGIKRTGFRKALRQIWIEPTISLAIKIATTVATWQPSQLQCSWFRKMDIF
jgi:hypothetical protein